MMCGVPRSQWHELLSDCAEIGIKTTTGNYIRDAEKNKIPKQFTYRFVLDRELLSNFKYNAYQYFGKMHHLRVGSLDPSVSKPTLTSRATYY